MSGTKNEGRAACSPSVLGCGDGASALDALLLAGLVVSRLVVVPMQQQQLSASANPSFQSPQKHKEADGMQDIPMSVTINTMQLNSARQPSSC